MAVVLNKDQRPSLSSTDVEKKSVNNFSTKTEAVLSGAPSERVLAILQDRGVEKMRIVEFNRMFNDSYGERIKFTSKGKTRFLSAKNSFAIDTIKAALPPDWGTSLLMLALVVIATLVAVLGAVVILFGAWTLIFG